MIRTNIKLLKPFSKDIAKCKSFEDYANIFWKAKTSKDRDDLKGPAGENFFDELCMKYPDITGFTTTEFRPSTPDEDYYEAVDTIGKTLKEIDGKQQDAIRQDKAYNPFNPNEKLIWDKISRVLKKVKDNSINGDHVLICTFLREKQLTKEVQSYFEWRVCRNHFENALKGNNEFFRNFAKRIDQECKKLDSQCNNIIENAKESQNNFSLMTYQKQAIKHSLANDISFIKLPPGSGKTEIQKQLAKAWIDNKVLLVYIAPTLDLLDQNIYKVSVYLKSLGIEFYTNMICSRKTFTMNYGETAFLDDDEIICGTNIQKYHYDSLTSDRNNVIGVTVASYGNLVKFCKDNDIKITRIVDEALEFVPGKEIIKEATDAKDELTRWNNFADMTIVNKSACFDAFEKTSKSDYGPGTNNKEVFGSKFEKDFLYMINQGTIVDLQLRVIKVNATDNRDIHNEMWSDTDKINFNAFCKALDNLINDDDVSNKKMIGFLHNAPICDSFKLSVAKYLQGKIDFVETIIAETKNRPALITKYKKAKDAVMLNYGCLGKGLDDSTTSSVFIGRNMASVYGMHGIHRGTRSHADEYGLPPEFHILKAFGIAYVPVIEDDQGSIIEYNDLYEMLNQLYSVGWKDNVKLVNPPSPKNDTDDDTNKPEDKDGLIDWKTDPELMDKMTIIKENIVDITSTIAYNKLVDKMHKIDKDDNYFESLLDLTN